MEGVHEEGRKPRCGDRGEERCGEDACAQGGRIGKVW